MTDDLWLEHGGASKGYTCPGLRACINHQLGVISPSVAVGHMIYVFQYTTTQVDPTSLFSFFTHHTWISYMCYKWHPKWGHSSYVVKALCDKLTHCAIKCAWKPYHSNYWTNQLDEEINTWPFCDLALSFQEGVAGWGPLIQKSQRHWTYLRRLLGTLTHDCMTTQLWIAALWHNYIDLNFSCSCNYKALPT